MPLHLVKHRLVLLLHLVLLPALQLHRVLFLLAKPHLAHQPLRVLLFRQAQLLQEQHLRVDRLLQVKFHLLDLLLQVLLVLLVRLLLQDQLPRARLHLVDQHLRVHLLHQVKYHLLDLCLLALLLQAMSLLHQYPKHHLVSASDVLSSLPHSLPLIQQARQKLTPVR